jgi:dienelactone hydrolase
MLMVSAVHPAAALDSKEMLTVSLARAPGVSITNTAIQIPRAVKVFLAFAAWGLLGCFWAICGDQETISPSVRVVSVTDLFADQTRDTFRISPDGKFVAFLHFDGAVYRLCIANPRNLSDTTLVATGQNVGSVFSLLWIDDASLTFAARSEQGRKTIIGSVSISSSFAESGPPDTRTKVLLEGANPGHLAGVILKGGSGKVLVAVPSNQGVGISDIVAIDPVSGEREFIHRNIEALPILVASSDGKVLAGIRCLPDGCKKLIGIRNGVAKEFLACGPDDSLEIAGLGNQGELVYIVTNAGAEVEFNRLESINLVTGERLVVCEDPQLSNDLCDAIFDREMRGVLACRFYRDQSEYVWLSSESEQRFKTLRALLPDGDLRVCDASKGGNEWIVTVTRDTQPDSEYFYDSLKGNLVQLSAQTSCISTASFGKMKILHYQARDGLIIPAYLTLPPGSQQKNLPVVVFPHGGPNKRNYWGYDPRVQFLASRGYVVFQPNFRGSSGFGKKFQNAGNRQWGRGVMQDDISDGVKWLISQGIANPDRVAIVGGSYGGFAALAGITFTPDLYQCGISLFGASNISEFVRDIPDTWKPFYGDIQVKIGNPESPADERRMSEQSPVHFTKEICAPVMVYHGALDKIVRRSQADSFVAACRKDRVDVEYLLAPDEGHGFTDPLNEQAVYVAIERFLAKHLGGRCQDEVPLNVEERLSKLRALTSAAWEESRVH